MEIEHGRKYILTRGVFVLSDMLKKSQIGKQERGKIFIHIIMHLDYVDLW